MSTGNRIQSRRESLGLSRKEFAARLGTTRMTVWRVENGKTPLRTEPDGPMSLETWARELGTTAAELVAA